MIVCASRVYQKKYLSSSTNHSDYIVCVWHLVLTYWWREEIHISQDIIILLQLIFVHTENVNFFLPLCVFVCVDYPTGFLYDARASTTNLTTQRVLERDYAILLLRTWNDRGLLFLQQCGYIPVFWAKWVFFCLFYMTGHEWEHVRVRYGTLHCKRMARMGTDRDFSKNGMMMWIIVSRCPF